MLKKRIDSFRYAFEGLFDLFRSEVNAWIHLAATFFSIAAGFYFSISTTEWCFVIFAIVSVLSAEAFNTAIEHLTNLVSPEYHILAKRTKDVAAAAVLLLAIGAALVGILIFAPKLIALWTN